MKKPFLKTLALLLLAAGALIFASCKDENPEWIIGDWTNVSGDSYDCWEWEDGVMPGGIITMEFTADEVKISDMRCNCIPEWQHYTLEEKGGNLVLRVDKGILAGTYCVEELSQDRMVLTPYKPKEGDCMFRYVMIRYELVLW